MSGKDRNVHSKQSRRGLGECYDINEIIVAQPLSLYEFVFYGSNHRDTSTYGECSDFRKDKKYLPQTDHFMCLSIVSGDKSIKIFQKNLKKFAG